MKIAHYKRLILLGLLGMAITVLTLSASAAVNQKAEKPENMRLLVEELDARALSTGLIYTIALATPLADEDRLSIGYGYDDIAISMDSIGADHFCIRRIAGSAERIHCIPYSNVAYIFYTNN